MAAEAYRIKKKILDRFWRFEERFTDWTTYFEVDYPPLIMYEIINHSHNRIFRYSFIIIHLCSRIVIIGYTRNIKMSRLVTIFMMIIMLAALHKDYYLPKLLYWVYLFNCVKHLTNIFFNQLNYANSAIFYRLIVILFNDPA